ncbi:MAG: hypothetical protein ABIB97_03755 [Patescibacteria group bacterium]
MQYDGQTITRIEFWKVLPYEHQQTPKMVITDAAILAKVTKAVQSRTAFDPVVDVPIAPRFFVRGYSGSEQILALEVYLGYLMWTGGLDYFTTEPDLYQLLQDNCTEQPQPVETVGQARWIPVAETVDELGL